MWVKAVWGNENPQSNSELTFKLGDIIFVHDQSGEWWDGELDGVRGFFPSGYVEPCEPADAESEPAYEPQPEPEPEPEPEHEEPVEEVTPSEPEKVQDQVFEETPVEQTTKKTVRALWDYEALTPQELSFSAGDVIYNVTEVDGDWWEGESANGALGCFPKSYVEEQESTAPTRVSFVFDEDEVEKLVLGDKKKKRQKGKKRQGQG